MEFLRDTALEAPVANLIIRGRVISDNLIEMGGRGGDLKFLSPDIHRYADQLPLGNPGKMADLYQISFGDILDYLEQLGQRLEMKSNIHMQRACELSHLTAPTGAPFIDAAYANLGELFRRDRICEIADKMVGIRYLEGWVEEDRLDGLRLGIRCFGARTVHVVAGNSPVVSVNTIISNAILRSDAIIKAPSNDPFTGLAIAQTMVEMAPDHPITRHLTVGYWRGGDVELEQMLYQPENVEKIVAWGGYASIKHITKYIQPGLELISLDPKRSASIIGGQAFENDARMQEAAVRLACDVGAMNQAACANARVVYVMSGTDQAGLEKLNRFSEYVYQAMINLPSRTSTAATRYDKDLKSHVDSLRFSDDWYRVIGGHDGEGAIIASQTPEEVEFSTKLADRTANLVPIDTLDQVVGAVNAYTQTVGVYPESFKQDLLNVLPLFGAQRFVSLGYACTASGAQPQDGLELLRRMGKWIINEIRSPETGRPPWLE